MICADWLSMNGDLERGLRELRTQARSSRQAENDVVRTGRLAGMTYTEIELTLGLPPGRARTIASRLVVRASCAAPDCDRPLPPNATAAREFCTPTCGARVRMRELRRRRHAPRSKEDEQ